MPVPAFAGIIEPHYLDVRSCQERYGDGRYLWVERWPALCAERRLALQPEIASIAIPFLTAAHMQSVRLYDTSECGSRRGANRAIFILS